MNRTSNRDYLSTARLKRQYHATILWPTSKIPCVRDLSTAPRKYNHLESIKHNATSATIAADASDLPLH
jgi:hypothetical protein